MIACASKEDIAEVARILAMQAAHYARKYGEEQLPDVAHLLSATTLEDDSVGLLAAASYLHSNYVSLELH